MDASTFQRVLDAFFFPPARQGVSSGTLVRFIQAAQNESLRVHDLEPILESNPIYTDYFLKQDLLSKRISEWNAENPEYGLEKRILLNRSLGLLGKTATRNAILSIAMARSVGVPFPRKGPKQTGASDPLKTSPKEQLLYALTAEDFCQEHNFVSSDIAFLGGLHYDFIAQRLLILKGSAELKNLLAESFKEGSLIARCAYQVAGKLKSVPLGKFVYGASLLLPLGKILMAFIYPKEHELSWTNFIIEIKKTVNCEWDYLEFLEQKRYTTTHLELSATYVSFFKHLRQIEPALTYCREPYVLKSIEPGLYSLSMILSLGRCIAACVSGIKTPLERVFSPFHHQWMLANKLSPEMIPEVIEKVKSGKDLGGA